MLNKDFEKIFGEYKEISVRYDAKTATIWCYFNPIKRPCFSVNMLQEIHTLQLAIIQYFKNNNMNPPTPINYFILASLTPDVYQYGGDLRLFSQLIFDKDRETLYNYAKLCIDTIHLNSVNLNLPITTIALVEGTALGGGLEAALSCDIIITQEGVKMGFPEIRFNLFPGMGAYSFLARRVGYKESEEIIASGKIYHAQELYEKNVVTIFDKESTAQESLDKFLKEDAKSLNGMQAIRRTRHIYQNISYQELLDITKVWVDTALKLKTKDLKVMKRFVVVQNKTSSNV